MLEDIFGPLPSTNQLIVAAAILVGAWLISLILTFILRHSKRLTSFTQSTLDDEIIRLLSRPIHVGFELAGVMIAFRYLFPDLVIRGFGYGELIPILLIAWIAYVANRMVRGMMIWHENQAAENGENIKRGTFGFLNTIISLLIWGFAFTFILNQVGIDISALLAGLGIAGLAIALALQNTLSGLFSAIGLVIDRPIRQGDFVKLEDGTEGFIEDISMRSTRIRTFDQNLVIVPNSKLTSMSITNAYLPEEEITLKIPVGVGYGSDLEKAEGVAIKIANEVLDSHGAKGSAEPFVRFKEFGDSSIHMTVYLRIGKFLDQFIVRHEFIKALTVAYKKAKIEIPFPQRDVHMKK
jgi:small-conductance mechanosensitive channel